MSYLGTFQVRQRPHGDYSVDRMRNGIRERFGVYATLREAAAAARIANASEAKELRK